MISFQEFRQWFGSTVTAMKVITFIILSLTKLAIITSVQKLRKEEETSPHSNEMKQKRILGK
jgi:hypothetical protein